MQCGECVKLAQQTTTRTLPHNRLTVAQFDVLRHFIFSFRME